MDEWGDLDARLERKKRVKLRRQQRELKRQQKEAELLDRARQKESRRCEEMAREDALSVAMMRLYERREELERREIQRAKDMETYAIINQLRRRAKQLGLPLSTPGMNGAQRLDELTERIQAKEKALETAQEARLRLNALPEKRSRVRNLLGSHFASSVFKKLEHAVFERRCEDIVELLDPKIHGKRAEAKHLNHESGNGLTPVLSMIYAGELTLLRRVLELGSSPNFETRDGVTPLLACVLVDNIVALDILVQYHVDLAHETKGNVKALLLAADKGRNEMLKSLLRLGVAVDDTNADGRTALMQAVINGHYESARILLAFNADVSMRDKTGRGSLDWARYWRFDHITSLLTAKTPHSALMALIIDQEERLAEAPKKIVEELINQQFKAPGTIAMEKALGEGNVPRILELLSINDTGYGPNFETPRGEMPLLVVSKCGTFDDLIFCLERKCGVSHCNREGVNALMAAAYHGNALMIELLVKAGCSILRRDFYGKDSFRYFHDNEQLETIDKLLPQRSRAAPSMLTLNEPVVDLSSLKASLLTASGKVTENQSGKEGSSCGDGPGDELNFEDHCDREEDKVEQGKVRKWSIRRHVLHRDNKKNLAFEEERQKIWKNSQRGRRNSLIAPLPFCTDGRLKFPPCENCHESRARKRCFYCDQVMCDRCHARIHELPHRRHHEYEELDPTLMLGTHTIAEIIQNQEEPLKATIDRTLSYVQAMKMTLSKSQLRVDAVNNDIEIEKYERKQRAIRETQIAHMQVNVPVAAAKHAIQAGDGVVFTSPAEIELADLYITQGKLGKARGLMDTTKTFVENALGILHPAMLKVQIRIARIDQNSGDLEKSLTTISIALTCFESILESDQRDLVEMQDLELEVLGALRRYEAAVDSCTRVERLRAVSLTASHPLRRQIQRRMDEYIAKRESNFMRQEDELMLIQAAISAEQSELNRLAQEKRRSHFQALLLTQEPTDVYNAFVSYAKKEFADDMVHFWVAVEQAKTSIEATEAKAFRSAVVSIFVQFIKARRIKIITAVQRKKMKKLITTPGKQVPRTIFDEVQALVFEVIFGRVFTRFELLNLE